jgi:DNA-binding SARP family transcriptional activator/predicted ATPase
VEFRVLGPIEVWDGERCLNIGPRMPKAVLAVLLLEPGRPVSLDRLIDLLWGEEPPATATGALQVYISGLRRVLEPNRSSRTPPAVLVTQPPGYALRVDREALDAVRFEAAITAGRNRLAGGDPAGARAALQEALALWRGSPYTELGFEQFLQAEIARLCELRAGACESLMGAELELGRHAVVIAELERLANEDPVRERRWELLALALYRDGRQADSLRVLQKARAVLGEELGIEPGPALRRLEDDILQQSPLLDQPVLSAPAAAVIHTHEHSEPGESSAARPLVGRDHEVADLVASLDQVVRGQGRAVLLAGEPGIGKTRLVEELGEVAATRDMCVAWGRCHEGDAAPAYWPWIQMIRALLAQGDSEDVGRALAVGAEELAQIVPDVKEYAGRELEPLTLLNPEAARTRLYDAVIDFVLRMAARRPLVLVVDDLHWADSPSLQLIRLLAARLGTASILLACTYRDHEADLSEPVVATLGVLARAPDLIRIKPAPLHEDEVARLVSHATGQEADPAVSEAIRSRTGGNPFFVSELVQLLRSNHRLDAGAMDAVRTEIPSGVRDVIRLRMARLPEATVSLLRLGAVAGRNFDLEVVAEAAGGDVDDALDRVEAALLVGVVVERPGRLSGYRFSHDLVRDTLYQELSAARRARAHRAVGEALERVGDESDTLEIADHFFVATPLVGRDKAYEWALRAADRASLLLAFEQVEEQLRRALDLTVGMAPGLEAARRELTVQIRLGSLLLMTSGYSAPEAGRAWSRATELCRTLPDTAEHPPAIWGAWSYACVRGEFSRALELAEELQDRGRRGGDMQFRLVAHHTLGVTFWHLGRLAEADAQLRQLGELCDALPAEFFTGAMRDRDLRVAHLIFGSVVHSLQGRASVDAELSSAVEAARRSGSAFTMVTVLMLAAVAHAIRGDRAAASSSAGEAATLAARHGFRQVAYIAEILCGWAAGDAEGMRRALASSEATGSRMLLHLFLGLLGEVEFELGHRADALACLERGLAESEASGEGFWLAELHRLRGEVLLREGPDRAVDARAAFERALSVARSQGAGVFELRVAESLRRSSTMGTPAG